MRKLLLSTLFALVVTTLAAQGELLTGSLSSRRFTTRDGLPQMQVETIWQDSRGYIYMGTLSGFVRYDGRILTPFLKGRRENIVGFVEVEHGKKQGSALPDVRALGFLRQWHVNGGDRLRPEPIDVQGRWLLNNFNATDLPSGFVLIEDTLEEHRRICRVPAKGAMETVLSVGEMDLMDPDRKLYADTTGVYIPTNQGLYVVETALMSPRKAAPKVQARILTPKSDIFSLCRVGGKLYALAADGVYTLTAGCLAKVCDFAFSAPDYGLFVRHDRRGRLLIADAHTVYQYDGQRMTTLAGGFNMVKGLTIDCWDRLWLATYQGAYCFFNRDFMTYRLADSNDIVRALAVDGRGQLVMGTLNGSLLCRNKAGTTTLLDAGDDNFYQPNAATLDGRVYMAGNGDVVAIDGEGRQEWLQLPSARYRFVARAGRRIIAGARALLVAYDPATAAVDTLTTQIAYPWTAATDKQGRLWVGASLGLYQMQPTAKGGAWQCEMVDYPQRLIITAMTPDNAGNVLFASNDSLFAIVNGTVSDLTRQVPQLIGHEIRALHVSPRGFIVIAAVDGLFVGRIANNATAKDGDTSVVIADVHFFDHTNGFTIVEPLMATMAETTDGTVWLSGLEEMASFRPDDLLASQQESTVVSPPRRWWQYWQAWVVAGLLLAGLIWLLARRYEERRNRKAMVQLRRERNRKELQINAIRLKAIPHFHANVMAGIEYFIMNDSAEEAAKYLKRYADFTSLTLSDIDRPARTVDEEVAYVSNYLELERLRYGDKLDYHINVSPEVDRHTMIPNMLLHTYCQNAVKHGIGNRPEGGRVEINIAPSAKVEKAIVVEVSDNGVGRAEAARLNRRSTKKGLQILLEQIALYNQMNRRPITQEVTDLYDDRGKPAGTRFAMTIPLDYQFED